MERPTGSWKREGELVRKPEMFMRTGYGLFTRKTHIEQQQHTHKPNMFFNQFDTLILRTRSQRALLRRSTGKDLAVKMIGREFNSVKFSKWERAKDGLLLFRIVS